MKYRRLGASGLKVSEICLGAWINFGERIDDSQTFAVIDAAVEAGIDFFDTADVYAGGKAEEVMGRWMQGKDRRTLTIATKCRGRMWPGVNGEGLSRKHIFDACHDSLRRLQTDYIDLYQVHWPDPETPLQETMHALDDLVKQGKVRYIGCSNFPAWQMTEAAWTARTSGLNGFISCQDEFSLVHREPEAELLPAACRLGLGLLPYFPLASGLLTGKYRRNVPLPAGTRLAGTQRLADRYLTDRNWAIAERLGDFAAAQGRSMLELAFSWLLAQRPVASVIAGATRPEQLKQNVKAGDWALGAEMLAEIDRITA